jgi:hypothetical protein
VIVRPLAADEWALLRELRPASLERDPDAFGSRHAKERALDGAGRRERLATTAWFVAEAAGRPGVEQELCALPLPSG